MMWHLGKQQQQRPKFGPVKRILLHLALFLLLWMLLMLVVIPWDTGGQYPPDSFALLEGQRAYAEVVREARPNLVTTLRGLNMVGARYSNEQLENGRLVSVGNVRICFEADGAFKNIELLGEPPAAE